jgi:hypothetical protein
MDKVTDALVAALKRALAEGTEQRLYRSGKLDGLFASRSGAAGEAATRALRDGLLELARTEAKGKTLIEWARLTPAGVDFLHNRESPAAALHELRETLRLNQQAVPAWLAEVRTTLQMLDDRLAGDTRQWLQRLDAMERRVNETLQRLEQSQPLLPPDVAAEVPWAIDAVNYLDRRLNSGATGDCPLPELFAAVVRQHAQLSVSGFHEGLRRLHDRRVLRLQPAAGLAELPQPEFALLDGGRVLYYVAR